MKTNGRIRELLAKRCYNETHFDDLVVKPLLEYLGIPSDARICTATGTSERSSQLATTVLRSSDSRLTEALPRETLRFT